MTSPPVSSPCCNQRSGYQMSRMTPRTSSFLSLSPILDHWHILFDALESAVTELEWWPTFVEHLRGVTELFAHIEHRDRFLAKCLSKHNKKLLINFTHKHVDWRWEVLEEILEDVLESWHILQYFELDVMLKTTDGTFVGNAVYKVVAE